MLQTGHSFSVDVAILNFEFLNFGFCRAQYEEIGEEVVGKLDGMFSFVLVDLRDNSFIAARDPLGITPLYLGWGNDGMLLRPN